MTGADKNIRQMRKERAKMACRKASQMHVYQAASDKCYTQLVPCVCQIPRNVNEKAIKADVTDSVPCISPLKHFQLPSSSMQNTVVQHEFAAERAAKSCNDVPHCLLLASLIQDQVPAS